jgi:hypothetical protein
LHVDEVEPSTKLESNFAEMGNLNKSVPGMESKAGFIAGINRRQDDMQASVAGRGDEWPEQLSADAAPPEPLGNVD